MANPFTQMLGIVRSLRNEVERLPEELAQASMEAMHDGFVRQVDPYGKPWAPTKTGKPFDQRNGLEWSARPTRTARGAFIRFTHKAFVFHQGGTVHLPQRMMAPEPGKGLGRWADHYQARCARAFLRAVGRGR